jgi:hypothetical protein
MALAVAALHPASARQQLEPALSARIDSLAVAAFEDEPGGVIVVARNGEALFRRAYGGASPCPRPTGKADCSQAARTVRVRNTGNIEHSAGGRPVRRAHIDSGDREAN